MDVAIRKVLESPQRKYTEEEAVAMLQRYGILDSDGNITPDFQQIIVKAEEGE